MRRAAVVVWVLLLACGRYTEPRMFSDELRRVPDVIGDSVKIAAAKLEDEGFLVRLQSESAPDEEAIVPGRCPRAEIARSDPLPGSRVVKATTVTLVVERCG